MDLMLNKNLIFPFLALILMFGCSDRATEPSLENGLKNYRKVRIIDETIIKGYTIKKWAFKKLDSSHYEFIFQLNNDVNGDTIEKYGLGLVYFADKKYLPENKEFLIVQTKPTLISKGEFKYIVETVVPPITALDSLHIFLSGREGYTGVIGNMVRLKNVQL